MAYAVSMTDTKAKQAHNRNGPESFYALLRQGAGWPELERRGREPGCGDELLMARLVLGWLLAELATEAGRAERLERLAPLIFRGLRTVRDLARDLPEETDETYWAELLDELQRQEDWPALRQTYTAA